MRIRERLRAKDYEQAAALVGVLEQLPAEAPFALRLTREKDKLVSNDSFIQKKIDKMLKDAEDDLPNFFAPRDVEEIDHEVRNARNEAAAEVKTEPPKDEATE